MYDADLPRSFRESCRLAEHRARERTGEGDDQPAPLPTRLAQTGSLTETVPEPTTGETPDDQPAPPPARDPQTGSLTETVPEATELISGLVSRWELATVHRVHALAASLGFGVREFLVLSELVVRPAGLTGAELTGVVGGSPARMSVLLAGLVERGLVERSPDLVDGRSMLAGATDKARELLPHEPPHRLGRRTGQELPRPEQLTAVTRFLRLATGLAYADGRYLRDLRYRPRRS